MIRHIRHWGQLELRLIELHSNQNIETENRICFKQDLATKIQNGVIWHLETEPVYNDEDSRTDNKSPGGREAGTGPGLPLRVLRPKEWRQLVKARPSPTTFDWLTGYATNSVILAKMEKKNQCMGLFMVKMLRPTQAGINILSLFKGGLKTGPHQCFP